ncbi:hypothetical protein M9458_051063, partial [Cirrhinus mrigala]
MQKPNNQRYSHLNDSAVGKCMLCGKQHPKTVNGPARRAECRKCGKRGHYAIVCRTLHVSDVKVVHGEHEDSFFLGAITVKDSSDSWTVTLRIQDTDVQFKIDTGSDISVMSEQTYEALNMKPDLTSTNAVLDCPGGKLRSTGRFETSTHYRANKYCFTVFVKTGQSVSNLLSREASAALGLVQRIDNVAHSPSASVGLLKTIPVRIKLKADAVPYAVTTARRVSVPLLPKVKAELERMVKCGVIEEITEPTEWCPPMVPVPRKSGQVRICVGLNHLNQAVERERYILPTLDDILPHMAGATMFSLLDAESGFWQIPLERESAKLTTFITPFGSWYSLDLESRTGASTHKNQAALVRSSSSLLLRHEQTNYYTEARYAQIEKECLSVVWACEKFSKYLHGLDSFVIHTDHKPLIPLINNKDIDMVPLRCQRLLIRLMKFNAKAEYVPGKLLVVADTLSRHPSSTPQLGSVELTDDITALEESTRAAWPVSCSRLCEVIESTQADSELQVVMKYVKQGWPKYPSQLPEYVKPYYAVRDMLSMCHDLLIYSDRIVIPSSMRAEIKGKLHEGHMGITKCRECAKQNVWWPGISKEIQVFTENCTYCQTQKPAQHREPLMTTPLPGNTGKTVTLRLSNMFARWGCPDTPVTDNGPQFSGQQFQNFAKAYGFCHVTTSPYFPQSN